MSSTIKSELSRNICKKFGFVSRVLERENIAPKRQKILDFWKLQKVLYEYFAKIFSLFKGGTFIALP